MNSKFTFAYVGFIMVISGLIPACVNQASNEALVCNDEVKLSTKDFSHGTAEIGAYKGEYFILDHKSKTTAGSYVPKAGEFCAVYSM